jgi:hypothetical protein
MTRLHGSEYRAAKADVMSLTATTETVSLSDMTDLQRGLRRALFPIMSKIFMTSAAVTCLQFLGNASKMCWRQTEILFLRHRRQRLGHHRRSLGSPAPLFVSESVTVSLKSHLNAVEAWARGCRLSGRNGRLLPKY